MYLNSTSASLKHDAIALYHPCLYSSSLLLPSHFYLQFMPHYIPHPIPHLISDNLSLLSSPLFFPPRITMPKLREEVEMFRPKVPLIVALRTPGMKNRHWNSLPDKTECDIPEDRWVLLRNVCCVLCVVLCGVQLLFTAFSYLPHDSFIILLAIKLHSTTSLL